MEFGGINLRERKKCYFRGINTIEVLTQKFNNMKNIIRISTIIALVSLLFGLPHASAQSEEPVKGFSITANVNGGFTQYLDVGGYDYLYAGGGVGMRYDFCRHWGVSAGLDYRNAFSTSGRYLWSYILLPVEMEFHTRHFYVRGGLVVGAGLDVWVTDKKREILLFGHNIDIGGRIPLTPADMITIGGTLSFMSGLEKIYDGDTYTFGPGSSRYGPGIHIGYEHRF